MLSEEERISLRDQDFHGVDVEFSRRSRIAVADRTRFAGCRISLQPQGLPAFRFGSRFHITRSVLEDSTITATGKVLGLKLTYDVKVHRCRFVGGPFVAARFGPEHAPFPDEPSIVECDFSAADLRDAWFYQTPQETLTLPAWPYITVVAQENGTVFAPPSQRHPALTALFDAASDFPWGDLALQRAVEALVSTVGVRPENASVQVCHADDIAKRVAGSAARLRTALEKFAHPAIRF